MSDSITLTLPNPAATHDLGLLLGRSLPAGTVLLLDGDLGSGKTTLVKGMGVGLGVSDVIVSPTFVLVNEYDDGRIPLYHFDLYRLQPSDIPALALDTYWDGLEYAPGLVAIEWADRLRDRPPYFLHIELRAIATLASPPTSSPHSPVSIEHDTDAIQDVIRDVTIRRVGAWPPQLQSSVEETMQAIRSRFAIAA